MNDGKLIDPVSGADVATTYEDRDGDWMLVGDVPWEYVHPCLHYQFPYLLTHNKGEHELQQC
jgi:hypothetical protein